MCINPTTSSIIAPQKGTSKLPWVLDESIPRPQSPDEIQAKIQKRQLERAKNKPDEERNFYDYMLLAQDKLKDLNTVKYLA